MIFLISGVDLCVPFDLFEISLYCLRGKQGKGERHRNIKETESYHIHWLPPTHPLMGDQA